MGVGAILALAPISGVTLRVCEYKDRFAMLAHHGRAMLARGPHGSYELPPASLSRVLRTQGEASWLERCPTGVPHYKKTPPRRTLQKDHA